MLKGLIVGGALLGIAAIGFGIYSSYYNSANKMENGITAQYEQNQNILTRLSNSVMEQAQVPEMARKNLESVIKAAMEGRYGDSGSKAYVQAITEAYPGTIDPSLYTRLQDTIEAGRTDFAKEQEKLIDKVRIYKTELGTLMGGVMYSMAGYPKINLDEYKIVISDYTADAFKTKRDNGLKLN